MTAIRDRSTETGRGRMRWLESGAGWPLILVHAFPLRAEMWRAQLEAAPAGWRFIAPDLRGSGDGPPIDGAVTMEVYARDVCELMDALAIEKAAIGGLSLGGYVTLAMYRAAPARFSGMVLADTRATADTPQVREGRVQLRSVLAAEGAAGVAAQMLPKMFSSAAPASLIDSVRTMIASAAADGIDAAIGALLDRPDSTPLLARINVPALVVVGEADVVTPVAESDTMQRAIPRSTLVRIPGAGHLSNLEQPAAFSRALADFLTGHF